MNTLPFDSYAFAALSFHCLFMVIFLFSSQEKRRDHLLLLGCIFLMLGEWYFTNFMETTGLYERYPWAINWLTLSVPLLMPSLYFYVQALSSQQPWKYSNQSRWHLYAALCIVLLELPFTFASDYTKLHQLQGWQTEAQGTALILVQLSWLTSILLFLQGATYIVLSIRRLLTHTVRIRHLFSNLENRTLLWLRNYLLLICLLWLLGLSDFINLPNNHLWIIHLIWIGTFSLLSLRQKPVFEIETSKQTATEPAPRTNKPGLPAERRARVAEKLRKAMDSDHLYRDADLTLRKLSDALGVSTHHISETLRDEIGQNFYDFINSSRIQEACMLLTKTTDATIDIAFAVGFNSRSTFSAAFKKHQGTSPAAYRKNAG